MADEFIERNIPPQKDCEEHPTWGRPSSAYQYIFKGNKKESDYPEDACLPWYHKTAQIDGLKINSPGITGTGDIVISGEVTAPIFNGSATSAKTIGGAFDIPHFRDEKKRIRESEPVVDGEIVMIDGDKYKARVLGDFSNCVVFDPVAVTLTNEDFDLPEVEATNDHPMDLKLKLVK